MKRSAKITAVLALVALLAPPTAWGCSDSGMEDCGMASCGIPDDMKMPDCHSGQQMQESKSCDVEANISLDCCGMSAAQEPVEATGEGLSQVRSEPLMVEAGELKEEVDPSPPMAATQALHTQQHSLGRYTLLSSFLL
jgi:hypothetical protein